MLTDLTQDEQKQLDHLFSRQCAFQMIGIIKTEGIQFVIGLVGGQSPMCLKCIGSYKEHNRTYKIYDTHNTSGFIQDPIIDSIYLQRDFKQALSSMFGKTFENGRYVSVVMKKQE